MTQTRGVTVEHLTKRYKDVTAVDDISFDVAGGSVFAFLGTNGAGKSTTISCLTTVLTPDSGNLTVAGHNVASEGAAVRRAIGVVFQDSLLDEALTVRENLAFRALPYLSSRQQVTERIEALIKLVELDDSTVKKVGKTGQLSATSSDAAAPPRRTQSSISDA